MKLAVIEDVYTIPQHVEREVSGLRWGQGTAIRKRIKS